MRALLQLHDLKRVGTTGCLWFLGRTGSDFMRELDLDLDTNLLLKEFRDYGLLLNQEL